MKRLLIFSLALSAQDGAAIYKRHCATCHDAAAERVPPFAALKEMSVAAIRASLESGKMREQAAALTAAERDQAAAYLGIASRNQTPIAYCKDVPAIKPKTGWNGWSPDPANTRMQPNPGWQTAAVPRLKLKWAFALGEGIVVRGQPSVIDGRLYIGSQSGTVYALDAATGCAYWTFAAGAQIRSGVVVAGGLIYFGDAKANVYALNVSTGNQLWKTRADDHARAMVTGTVQWDKEILYVPVASSEEAIGGQPSYQCCTFRGSLLALDAKTGKQLWKTYVIPEASKPTKKNSVGTQLHGPSGAGVWSTPTIDTKSNHIYIATGDNYSDPPTKTSDAVIALDLKSGRTIWTKQLTANDVFIMGCGAANSPNCPETSGPDHDLGQPPILVDLANGKRALVVGQKSGVAHALDPDNEGAILWQTRVGIGGTLGGIQWGSAADARNMYVAVSDLAFKDRSRDPSKGGGLFALQLATGEKIWSASPSACPQNKPGCSPGHSAAVTATPGAVFAGSLDGHIRAFSTANGQILWDFDTAREFETTNGDKAKGGSIDGPGPVIANGMLFTNSGYGMWGGMPGNVLLAFSIDGK